MNNRNINVKRFRVVFEYKKKDLESSVLSFVSNLLKRSSVVFAFTHRACLILVF